MADDFCPVATASVRDVRNVKFSAVTVLSSL